MRKILTKKEADEVLDLLEELHPDARCELEHRTPFELLIATILSAQCTDVRVNAVTEELFKVANTPKDFVEMGIEEIKRWIKPCGFYNNKAKNILSASEVLISEYNSEIPTTIEELMQLPGVGRKTANVVASNCFGVPAIAVDTHVFRLSNRIGFVNEKDVEKTELALQRKIDKKRWTLAHHTLIFHGRRVCKARKPLCENCNITEYCRHYLGGDNG
ncbi:DNA-(apurinic or apyrimidinic site) lyase /endonuclease III [Peptoniphilus asaccharolyticus DSM 20463]|uniref:Endonuclease III n=1 Tax=Peptoniphilus asaccharolyticus DSM 20463 TaxID=573058 RepID=A0A1W1V0B8_PEPAS|nr:endonuclease III [Peptoniphilus asaccharolyticus]MBL7575446.1 endonuclease III [Peptoniphilus asaccharolyticus]SMB86789.1 DNA-(apurinic or apyrimidinic site) lyase /endonuclease III [Peptoniphilus asaccharolyticus DSM 20463]